MITKRTFAAGSASLAASVGLGLVRQGSAETVPPKQAGEILLRAEATTLALNDPTGGTAVVRIVTDPPPAVIRIRKGQEAVLRVENGLDQPMSLQWNGLRGLGALDDPMIRAAAAIPADGKRLVRLTPLDSGTSWFHAPQDSTNQTAKGLRGVMIVEEPTPPACDRDLVVLLADWRIDAAGHLQLGSTVPDTVKTNVVTTNGEAGARELAFAPASRIRLRLVNGSVQRVMLVACEGARPMILAIDGQPSDLFEPSHNTIPMGPGSRFDLMLDLPATADATVRLILKGTEPVAGVVEADRPLILLRTAGDPKPPRSPIAPLEANPALPKQIPLEASKRAELTIDGKPGTGTGPPSDWTVNGISGVTMPAKPILKVKRGDAVTLGFTNKSSIIVPIRVLGHSMRLLHAKDDGWEPYWRDSLLLPPGSRNHVAFIADVPGRWSIESGFDDLAVAGLRCWFEVTP